MQQVLADILEAPLGDHSESVAFVMKGGVILDAHVAGMRRAHSSHVAHAINF